MTTRGERFVAAYNKIDDFLRKTMPRGKPGRYKHEPFTVLMQTAAETHPTLRHFLGELEVYARLRNAIVHDAGIGPSILADPREDAVLKIEHICDRLLHPRRLRDIPLYRPIRIFGGAEPIAHVLAYMKEHDFSQVIASSNAEYVILSAEGIAHWLENKVTDDILALSEVPVREALRFEPPGTCIYARCDDTVEAARELFIPKLTKRVFSALVSESGKPDDRPLNILTPWDFVTNSIGVPPKG